jgi:hypothetical protein
LITLALTAPGPGEDAVLYSVSFVALYVDPGSGSMILQLLLGGVSGLYVIFRLFKQKILMMFGIHTESPQSAGPQISHPLSPKNEDRHGRSA